MKSLFLSILLITLLACYINAQAPCSTTCTTDNLCMVAFCNTDDLVCDERPKDPLPEGCCVFDSDCDFGDCVLQECDSRTNQCIYEIICSVEEETVVCTDDNDCVGLNFCRDSKCLDGVCRTTDITNRQNPLCCVSAVDCEDVPCKNKQCNKRTGFCIYTAIDGCTPPALQSIPTIIADLDLSPTSPSSPNVSAESQDSPGLGDIIGAIIGFIILGLLVLAFIIVVILMIIQKVFRRVSGE